MMRLAACWVAVCGAGLLGCVGQITADDVAPGGAELDLGGAASGDARVPEVVGGSSPSAGAGASSDAGRVGDVQVTDAGTELGERPSTEPAEARVYCDAPTLVLTASCGNGSCHSNGGVAIGDFAIGPERIPPFIDKVSTRGPQCGLIIDTHDPNASLILTKVIGTYPDGCGGAMPVGSFGDLTEAQIECLANWVQQFRR